MKFRKLILTLVPLLLTQYCAARPRAPIVDQLWAESGLPMPPPRLLTNKTDSGPSSGNNVSEIDKKLSDATIYQNATCNVPLLDCFGMIGPKISAPFFSGPNELKYCPRNKYSCCTSRHIESIMPLFSRAYFSFREFFTLVEEMLTLFRGKMYIDVFKDLSKDRECHYLIDEFGDVESHEEYFSIDYQQRVASEADSLLNELFPLIREEINYFSSLICTVCSPKGQTAFNISPTGSLIKVHYSTCNQMIETQEIYLKLAEFVVNHLQPLAKLIGCNWDVQENPDYAISDMNIHKLEQIERNIAACKASPDKNIPACMSICAKSLFGYKISSPLTRANLRALYRNLFLGFTYKEADIFQKMAKGVPLSEQAKFEMHFFSPLDVDFKHYRLSDITWEFSSSGERLFYNDMATEFFLSLSAGITFKLLGFVGLALLLA